MKSDVVMVEIVLIVDFCRGCSLYTAQSRVPMPSPFVCLTDWKCSCAWGSKLQTIFLLEAFDGRG